MPVLPSPTEQAQVVAGNSGRPAFRRPPSRRWPHALIVHGRRGASGDGDREQEVIAHFAEPPVADVAPTASRHPISTDEGVIEAIAAIVRGHLQAGALERLPASAPDLVYLALMPYARARRGAPLGRVRRGPRS